MLKIAIYVCVPLMIGLIGFITLLGRRWHLPVVKRLPVLALYCVAVTFFSPTIVIYIALCSLVVPLFAKTREEIVPIFVFAMLLLPSMGFTANFGSLKLLPITGFTTLGVGAAVWAIVKGRAGERRSYLAGLCICALFVVLMVANARATSLTNYLRVALDLCLALFVPFYVIRRCVKSANDIRLVIVALVAITAGLSAVAIFEANASWPLYRAVYGHYGIELGQGAAVKLRGGLLRSPGPFIEPTSFALWLALGTGALVASPWLFRSKFSYGLMIAFLLVGLFAPQSRGAWLGLIVFYATFQAVNGKSASLLKPALFAAAAGVLIYGTALAVPRVGSMIGLDTTGTVQRDYRQDLFSRGLEESRNNLLVGTDLGRVKYALRDMIQGEGQVDFVNSYLYVLLVTGLLGLTAFGFILLAPLTAAFRLRTKATPEDRASISFVIAALGSIVVMIAFTSLGGRTIIAIVMLLGLIGSLLNARRSAMISPVTNGVAGQLPGTSDAMLIGGPPGGSNPAVAGRPGTLRSGTNIDA